MIVYIEKEIVTKFTLDMTTDDFYYMKHLLGIIEKVKVLAIFT